VLALTQLREVASIAILAFIPDFSFWLFRT
jgi:hypothetical protein